MPEPNNSTNPNNPQPNASLIKKPLVANGPLFLNPERILWANMEAVLPKGVGVEIQFLGVETTTQFYDGDAEAAAAILLTASQEAPNA